VSFLIVEKSTDAELLGGCSVPAGPVPGARGFVSEDTVQPVAMFSTLGRIFAISSLAVNVVRVVAHSDQSKSSLASIDQTIGTAR